jgi:hypothetical protein
MKEPPALKDRNGEKIVVFRNSDGSFFSNHPDYPMALALHEQAQTDDEVEEDEAPTPDNGDGQVQYSEMKSADLVAAAKDRGMSVPSGTKRSQVIAMLEEDDAKATEAK